MSPSSKVEMSHIGPSRAGMAMATAAATITMTMREADRLKTIQAVVDRMARVGQAAQRLSLSRRRLERLALSGDRQRLPPAPAWRAGQRGHLSATCAGGLGASDPKSANARGMPVREPFWLQRMRRTSRDKAFASTAA